MVSKLGGSPSPGEVCPPAPRRAPLGLPWGFPRPLPTLRAAPGRARLDPHFVAAGLWGCLQHDRAFLGGGGGGDGK